MSCVFIELYNIVSFLRFSEKANSDRLEEQEHEIHVFENWKLTNILHGLNKL